MSASDPLAVTAEFKPSQAPRRGIEYLRSLKVIFEHPEWLRERFCWRCSR
jgi:hypothetical protein